MCGAAGPDPRPASTAAQTLPVRGRYDPRSRSPVFASWLGGLLPIQAAMGWTNTHLYEIRARDVGWSTPDADADWGNDFLDARKAGLGDVLEDLGTKTLKYLYDFGDGWEHTIKIERFTDPEPGLVDPRLTEVSGRCPPEDCGGPWGYAELIKAIKDPKHERHDELTE